MARLLSTPRALLAVAILRFPGLPLIYFYNHRSADIFGSDVEVLVFFSLHMWLGGIAFAQVRTPSSIPKILYDFRDGFVQLLVVACLKGFFQRRSLSTVVLLWLRARAVVSVPRASR